MFPNLNVVVGKKYKDRIVDSSTTLTEILLDDFHTAVVPAWSSARKDT